MTLFLHFSKNETELRKRFFGFAHILEEAVNTRTGDMKFGKITGEPALLRAIFTIMKAALSENSDRKPSPSPPLTEERQ